MADTIGGGINDDGSLQNTLIIDEADLGKIDIVDLENAGLTELAVNTKLEDFEIGLKGDQDVVLGGKKLVNPTLINEGEIGKTTEVKVTNKKTKNLVYESSGKASTDFTFSEGKHVKFSITTAKGKVDDEITVGSSATLNKGFISLGNGDDKLVIKGGTTLKGKTVIETGKGKDVIKVGQEMSGKGKLVISDFSKNDKIKSGGETIKLANLDDAPSFIKFDS